LLHSFPTRRSSDLSDILDRLIAGEITKEEALAAL
jgi:hypothetical protein